MYNSSTSSTTAAAAASGGGRYAAGRRSENCESSSVVMSNHGGDDDGSVANTTIGLRPSFGLSFTRGSSPPSLVRHSSSPAVFLNPSFADKNGGFSLTREGCSSKGIGDNGYSASRLSFNGSESLSRISDHCSKYQPLVDPILFSIAQRADGVDSHSQFTMSQGSMGMASNNNLINIPPDSVPCKMRAKRGCATHPRSIAERERRTRISGKLKKLQDLVPNMDKQTSYADMLDLAVQHIKCLQTQVQKLNDDLEGCSCGSNRNRNQLQQLLNYKH